MFNQGRFGRLVLCFSIALVISRLLRVKPYSVVVNDYVFNHLFLVLLCYLELKSRSCTVHFTTTTYILTHTTYHFLKLEQLLCFTIIHHA